MIYLKVFSEFVAVAFLFWAAVLGFLALITNF